MLWRINIVQFFTFLDLKPAAFHKNAAFGLPVHPFRRHRFTPPDTGFGTTPGTLFKF
jgi:hypothetical protein